MPCVHKPEPQFAFQRMQYAFTAHIRDPQKAIPASIEDRRMQIYRELFFNAIEGFIASAFPVTKSIMPEQWWQQAVRDFMIEYRCDSPYFNKISEQFLTFISNQRSPQMNEPPFLHELMHYEWIELALDTAEADPFTHIEHLSDNVLDHAPQLSPLAWSLNYTYPVHQINSDFQPDQPSEQPVWLLVYRNKGDHVKFMELNPVSARLIELIDHEPLVSGHTHLLQIANEMQLEDPTPVIQGGSDLLNQFYDAGIVLGAEVPSNAPSFTR